MRRLPWADRGQQCEPGDAALGNGCTAVARQGGLRVPAGGFTLWIQLRGRTWVEAKEGRFHLRRGDWMAFERESRPWLQADRGGLCIGIQLDADGLRTLEEWCDGGLYAGHGRIDVARARVALRLWRHAQGQQELLALRPLLSHLVSLQARLAQAVQRCPGRSRSRKRQVFGRLQRAWLYLHGNCDRVVRIDELARLTSFSNWYLSKTFHSLYDESPQEACSRMRMERAADLLRDPTLMIGEVAALSGFDNCCSFARAFRTRYGKSASEYRRAIARTPDPAKPMDVQRKVV